MGEGFGDAANGIAPLYSFVSQWRNELSAFCLWWAIKAARSKLSPMFCLAAKSPVGALELRRDGFRLPRLAPGDIRRVIFTLEVFAIPGMILLSAARRASAMIIGDLFVH